MVDSLGHHVLTILGHQADDMGEPKAKVGRRVLAKLEVRIQHLWGKTNSCHWVRTAPAEAQHSPVGNKYVPMCPYVLPPPSHLHRNPT